MLNVEAEVSKYKNCKDRDEVAAGIREYKNLAMQHASDLYLTGQYNAVAHKLQEIFDKLPAPKLKNVAFGSHASDPTKTANISKEEKAKINAAWKKKTSK